MKYKFNLSFNVILFLLLVIGFFVLSPQVLAECTETNGHSVCGELASQCIDNGTAASPGPWTRIAPNQSYMWPECAATGATTTTWISDFSQDCGGCNSPSQCKKPIGYVNQGGSNCSVISGWAGDPDGPPSTPISVHFYKDDPSIPTNFIGATTANGPSGSAVCNAIGDSTPCAHWFTFSTPVSLKDGKSHDIYVYGINSGESCSNQQLQYSGAAPMDGTYTPITISGCGLPKASLYFHPQASQIARVQNNVPINVPQIYDVTATAADTDSKITSITVEARPCGSYNGNCTLTEGAPRSVTLNSPKTCIDGGMSCTATDFRYTFVSDDYTASSHWKLYVRVSTASNATCDGNDATDYTGARCDSATKLYDFLDVYLAPPVANINGKVYRTNPTAGVCITSGNITNSNSTVSVTYKNASGVLQPSVNGTVNNDGTYTVGGIPLGSLLQSVCFSNPPYSADANYSYDATCPVFNRSGSCLNYTSTAISGDLTGQDIGFKLNGPGAWKTVVDGDVMAGNGNISMAVPATSSGGFTSNFINTVNAAAGYAFSSANQLVGGGTNSNISELGGYFRNLSTSPLDTLLYSVDASRMVALPNDLKNLDPSQVYTVSNANLAGYLGSNTTFSFSPTATDGVVVIYVTPRVPSFSFGKNLTYIDPTNTKRRLLFVFLNSPTYSSPTTNMGVGIQLTGLPSTSSVANIQAGILSTGGVTFLGGIGYPRNDGSILIDGPIYTRSAVTMRRDRGDTNTYPAEILRFSTSYLYGLTNVQRQATKRNLTGLFVSNTRWENN